MFYVVDERFSSIHEKSSLFSCFSSFEDPLHYATIVQEPSISTNISENDVYNEYLSRRCVNMIKCPPSEPFCLAAKDGGFLQCIKFDSKTGYI